jgi:hypothetical protein
MAKAISDIAPATTAAIRLNVSFLIARPSFD